MRRKARKVGPDYCEQGFSSGSRFRFGGGRPLTHFCYECRHTAKKSGLCPTCRKPMECAGLTARPPKKTASKKKWEAFRALKGSHTCR